MTSDYESFWSGSRFAVVGHSAKRPFPRLTYGALKARGSSVYAIDPSTTTIEGDPAYPDFMALPGEVDGAVLELPRDETRHWLEKAADRGIREVWLHQGTESPEALAVAKERNLHLRTGTCAVMYLSRGFSPHTIHGFFRKLAGKY